MSGDATRQSPGLLLVNLGTPEAPTPAAVRRYLRQFLSDPRVLDMAPAARWLLLNLVILPFRPAKSAAAYASIWTAEGSPLLVHSRALAAGVGEALGQSWRVELAMRYGEPSIAPALRRLQDQGVDTVYVLPLYPQYASSSVGSTLEEVYRLAGQLPVVPRVVPLACFYDHPAFLGAVAAAAREAVSGADHTLFSFHGVPEHQVRATEIPTPKGKDSAVCLASPGCCDAIDARNRACYRAQCFATARGLAARLGLADGAWSVSFPSRLGRVPWIRPYTDEVIPALARRGTRRLAVLCPSFVADGLETVEEIGMRGEALFRSAGGEALRLAPCPNSRPDWVEAVVTLAKQARSGLS